MDKDEKKALFAIMVVALFVFGSLGYMFIAGNTETTYRATDFDNSEQSYQQSVYGDESELQQLTKDTFGMSILGFHNPIKGWNHGKQHGTSHGDFKVRWIKMPSSAGKPHGKITYVKCYTNIKWEDFRQLPGASNWVVEKVTIILLKVKGAVFYPIAAKSFNAHTGGVKADYYRKCGWCWWQQRYVWFKFNCDGMLRFGGNGIYMLSIYMHFSHLNWKKAGIVHEYSQFYSDPFGIK